MNKLSKNKGFTIVELIVVMAIIAILTLIAIPTLSGYIGKAQETSETGSANSIYKSAVAAVVDFSTSTDANTALDDDEEITSADVPFGTIYTQIADGVNIQDLDLVVYADADKAVNYSETAWTVVVPTTTVLDPSGDILVIAPITGNVSVNGAPPVAQADVTGYTFTPDTSK